MADFYARMTALAQRQIDAKGRTLTFYASPTAPDPSKPWRVAENPTHTSPPTAKGVIFPFELAEIDDVKVLRGDMRCFTQAPMTTGATAPAFKKVLDSLDSSVWTIISMRPIAPGPSVVLYELHLRQ